MTSRVRHLHEFGPYRLDVAERRLLRDGEPVELTAKVFDLLVLMVENPGKLLEKAYLLEALWPDSFVEEVNLSVNVSALRKALGEDTSDPQYIETVPKRGYRFIGSVRTQKQSCGEGLADAAVSQASDIISTADEKPSTEHPASERAVQGAGRKFARRRGVFGLAVLTAIVLFVAAYALYRLSNRRAAPFMGPRTIAVLPFKTLTSNDADQALGLGMADALITRLGNIQQVVVRPTSTILKYSDASKDSLTAGRELGVETVLDGRVQRDDKKIRVTAQLLRVQDGASLWSGKFDDFFTNLFALQDSISERMAEALSLRLTRDEQQQMARRDTENTEAYQLYLQGRYFYFKYQFEKAREFLEQAIEKDPDYSLAYTGIAVNCVALAARKPNRQEMRDKAMEAATKALRLDPDLDEAHNAMGWVKFLGDWDWSGAEASLRRATELSPNNADAHTNLAAVLISKGNLGDGLRESERALQLDPVSGDVNANHAYHLLFARRYDQALEQGRRLEGLDPYHPSLRLALTKIYIAISMFEQAIEEAKKQDAEDVRRMPLLAAAYIGLGRRAEAEAILQTLLLNPGRPGGNCSIAIVYAALGDKEQALDWLEKAYQARDNQMIRLKVDPIWDSLRNSSRFSAILQRMGL